MRCREPEHVEQKALFHWAALHEARVPELKLLFAVPNGRKRTPVEAGKLKAEGVKPGVPDVFLPVARGCFNGLFIEMKAPGKRGYTSDEQDEWHVSLRSEGWYGGPHDSWRSAWNTIVWYLGRPDLAQPLLGGVA